MRDIINKSIPFLFLCSLFWLFCLYLIFTYPKGAIELDINWHCNPIANTLFKYNTLMGDGAFHAALIVAFFFIDRKFFWIALISFILIAVLSPLFKHYFYPDSVRPSVFFAHYNIHYVDGVKLAHANSFPSGHTMTAFAWGLWLAVFFNKNYLTIVLFALSFLVAFSRVYLMQHFIVDVFAGSVIGVWSMYASFYIYELINNRFAKAEERTRHGR